MKYLVAVASLQECKKIEDIEFRNGALRQIEELQIELISHRKQEGYINHITGEKSLAK